MIIEEYYTNKRLFHQRPVRSKYSNSFQVDTTFEAVVRRDRLVVVTALTAVIALSWAYLLAGAGMGMSAFEMTRMSQLGMEGAWLAWR